MFLAVLLAAPANSLNPRRRFLKLPIFNHVFRSTGDNLDFRLVSEVEWGILGRAMGSDAISR